MADAIGKALVTNLSALSSKYGPQVSIINQALDRLVRGDLAKGVTTQVIGLDDAASMARLGASAVTVAADPKQSKAAIDALFAKLNPSYVMILGSTDIVPHQPMVNPTYTQADPDEFAFGDLPYACDAPYSDQPADFIGPTRVVGRLPDVTGVADPSYLAGLLGEAATWRPRSRSAYSRCLGISTAQWQGSTSLSLTNLVGSSRSLHLSPFEGPQWPSNLLGRRTHFINCHGAESDCHFYGQLGDSYPVAHDAQAIGGRVSQGTVVTAECCYGAQLYDPTSVGGVAGICNTYLAGGAFGFFGSSTIAYGPADGNGSADLLCQYFLRYVLEGASLGRAVLQARQDFVRTQTVVDPADLKTLAQFSLMGDPSIHPVLPQSDVVPVALGDTQKALPPVALRLLKGRANRRANLAATGYALAESTAVASIAAEVPVAARTISTVMELAGATPDARRTDATGSRAPELRSFAVSSPRVAQAKSSAAMRPSLIHVVARRTDQEARPVAPIELLIAKEVDGRITSFRRLFGK